MSFETEVSDKGGATVGQWGQTAPTGMRLWGQNYVFAPTENQQVLNEECLFTQEQNIKLAGCTCSKEFCDWRQKEVCRENVLFDYRVLIWQ